MHVFKRVIVSVIILALSINSVVFANVPADVKNTEYETAVSVLSDLNILEGDNNGNFRPQDTVTRAEMAVFIVRMLGLEEKSKSASSKNIFTDVENSHWAVNYINTAAEAGVITGLGDGTFGPNEPVTYGQAVKMLVCTVGYEIYAKNTGGYPVGYLSIAAEVGISKGIKAGIGDYALRGMVAQMVYNALDVDLLAKTKFGQQIEYEAQRNKTLLTEKHNIYVVEDQITGNYDTYIDRESDTALSEDEIQIGDIICKIGKTSAHDLLGYLVKAYYYEDKDNGQKVLLSVYKETSKYDYLEINAEDLEGYVNNTLGYSDELIKDGKVQKAKISVKADVIYNGKAYPDYAANDLLPDVGKVALLDTDKDNEYDVVFVTAYTICIVDRVNVSEKTIYDKYSSAKNMQFDEEDIKYSIVNKAGKKLQLGQLKEYDVLSVAKSNDGKLFNMIASDQKVEGVAEEVAEAADNQEGEIGINGKKYKVSPGYTGNRDNIPSVGDAGMFYLDYQQKIVAFKSSAIRKRFGYLVKALLSAKGIETSLKCRIFDEESQMKMLKSAEKITIDGTSYEDAKQALVVLKEYPNSRVIKRQLVKYELNDMGEIKSIDLAYSNTVPKKVNESEDSLYNFYTGSSDLKYKEDQKTFSGKVNLDSGTLVFKLPSDPSVTNPTISDPYSTDYSNINEPDDDAYSVDNTENSLADDESYTVTAFRTIKEALVAEALVIYGKSQNTYKIDTSITVVDKVVYAINNSGETVQKLYGFTQGKKVEFFTTDNTIFAGKDIKQGDVLRMNTGSGNEITGVDYIFNSAKRTILPTSEGTVRGNPTSSSYTASDRFIYGSVHSIYGDVMRVTTGSVAAATEGELENFVISQFKIYIYDSDAPRDHKMRLGTAADVVAYKLSASNYSKVFIRTSYGKVRDLVIYQ